MTRELLDGGDVCAGLEEVRDERPPQVVCVNPATTAHTQAGDRTDMAR